MSDDANATPSVTRGIEGERDLIHAFHVGSPSLGPMTLHGLGTRAEAEAYAGWLGDRPAGSGALLGWETLDAARTKALDPNTTVTDLFAEMEHDAGRPYPGRPWSTQRRLAREEWARERKVGAPASRAP